jgi:hypothetical protein
MKITFEPSEEQSGSWIFHYGNVEQNGKEFEFSLLEMKDGNSDSKAFELTWCEETPDNAIEIEKKVIREFEVLQIA